MSKRTEFIHSLWEFSIKYKLSLPCFFWFSPVWEINPKNIIGRISFLEDKMYHSSFICSRISFKSCLNRMNILLEIILYPDTRSCISCLFRWIIKCFISQGIIDGTAKFIRGSLDFLKKEYVRIIHADDIGEFSFFFNRSYSVYIPWNDSHKKGLIWFFYTEKCKKRKEFS